MHNIGDPFSSNFSEIVKELQERGIERKGGREREKEEERVSQNP